MYADIIVDISHEALDRVFEYRVPDALKGSLLPGMRVRIPFGAGSREREGYVIALKDKADYDPEKIKDISGILPDSVPVESQLIRLADDLRRLYGSTMAQALRTVLPVKRKIRHKTVTYVSLKLPKDQAGEIRDEWDRKHYRARVRLMDRLMTRPEVDSKVLIKECGVSGKDLKKLEDQGIIRMESSIRWRKGIAEEGRPVKKPPIPLNPDQQAIVDSFLMDMEKGIKKTYLLYGVTGSGKTEVYLALIDRVIRSGRQAIVLIPEISLTFQTVRRFSERFGDRIAVIHSRMSAGERSDQVERITRGQADVVIGARSALFAPVRNLGLIIIDEEHDTAYKSDSTPKYHAREAAIRRAELAGASLVLGSATPSVESYQKAVSGEYGLWRLDRRAGAGRLPQVRIVDLREEFLHGNRSVFSEDLKEGIRERLSRGEQIMLFLNRRGYAGFVSCRSCGQVIRCPHCDVSLTYHRDGSLRCHYCGYQTPYQKLCPVCGMPHVAAFGLGTEKVESALHAEFPQARILRMDADTTRKKHGHEEILSAFSAGQADILLGTQMIVKGHDYANVTLVGILAADLSLNSADYRSAEKTFQLLCQAAGRAGRGEKAGQVVIQTYHPDHYAIRAASSHSYEDFFEQEYAYRSLMGYPPCGHMLVILIQSGDETQAVLASQRIQKIIAQSLETSGEKVSILNPGGAAVARIKDVYRQVLYLKGTDLSVLVDIRQRLEPVLLHHPLFAGITVQFDTDPMNRY
ncbi:MAG: primosomal protein N' [Eubacterium sp.]|nr:primosomal protein N' [Eubacterium sp.]